MYHELHGHDDLRTRAFTFLQMGAVVSMSVLVRGAFGTGAAGFALSFAVYQLIMTYLWAMTGVHDPDHRPLSAPYSTAFFCSAMLIVVFASLDDRWRVPLWTAALALSTTAPHVSLLGVGRDDPTVRAEFARSQTMTAATVERFGLLTMIVLGELIVGIVRGLASHEELSWSAGFTGALALAVGIGLWSLYFDFVAHRLPRPTFVHTNGWALLHLFATARIVATGATLSKVVEHVGRDLPRDVAWLLVGGVTSSLVCIALLLQTLMVEDENHSTVRQGSRVTMACALIAPLPAALGLSSNLLLLPLVVVLALPALAALPRSTTTRENEERR